MGSFHIDSCHALRHIDHLSRRCNNNSQLQEIFLFTRVYLQKVSGCCTPRGDEHNLYDCKPKDGRTSSWTLEVLVGIMGVARCVRICLLGHDVGQSMGALGREDSLNTL